MCACRVHAAWLRRAHEEGGRGTGRITCGGEAKRREGSGREEYERARDITVKREKERRRSRVGGRERDRKRERESSAVQRERQRRITRVEDPSLSRVKEKKRITEKSGGWGGKNARRGRG